MGASHTVPTEPSQSLWMGCDMVRSPRGNIDPSRQPLPVGASPARRDARRQAGKRQRDRHRHRSPTSPSPPPCASRPKPTKRAKRNTSKGQTDVMQVRSSSSPAPSKSCAEHWSLFALVLASGRGPIFPRSLHPTESSAHCTSTCDSCQNLSCERRHDANEELELARTSKSSAQL